MECSLNIRITKKCFFLRTFKKQDILNIFKLFLQLAGNISQTLIEHIFVCRDVPFYNFANIMAVLLLNVKTIKPIKPILKPIKTI